MGKILIYIIGEINCDTVDSVFEQIENQNFDAATEIEIRINSGGGDVFSGLFLYDFFTTDEIFAGKKIITKGVGMVASIATILFLIGEERYLSQNCAFGVHKPYGDFQGATKEELDIHRDNLSRVETLINNMYAPYGFGELTKEMQFYFAEDCVKRGIANKIIDKQKVNVLINTYLNSFQPEIKKTIYKQNNIMNIRKILNLFKNELKAQEVSLSDGTLLFVQAAVEGEISVGDTVVLAESGETPKEGVHVLSDGTMIVTDSEGVITEKIMAEEIVEMKAKLKEYEEKEISMKAEKDEDKAEMKNEVIEVAGDKNVEVQEQEIMALKKELKEMKNLFNSLSTKKVALKNENKIEVVKSDTKVIEADFTKHKNLERLVSNYKNLKK